MKTAGDKYRLRIRGLSLETISLERLAKYITAMASVLGHPEKVHFVKLVPGSIQLECNVEEAAISGVQSRLKDLATSVTRKKDPSAVRAMKSLLHQDGAYGEIVDAHDQAVLSVSSAPNRFDHLAGLSVTEDGDITGQLVQIGGRGSAAHVHLREEPKAKPKVCDIDQKRAQDLARYLYGPPIHVRGTGTWRFERGIGWDMKKFKIQEYDVMEDISLSEAIATLRSILKPLKIKDPLGELHRIRHGYKEGDDQG